MQHRTTKAEQEQLISDYIDGVQVKELAFKYHISTVAIYGLLKRRGFTMKPQTEAQRKYSIDESFFDSIDTEEKAYFVGFLFADGYNNTERHSVNLQKRIGKFLSNYLLVLKRTSHCSMLNIITGILQINIGLLSQINISANS